MVNPDPRDSFSAIGMAQRFELLAQRRPIAPILVTLGGFLFGEFPVYTLKVVGESKGEQVTGACETTTGAFVLPRNLHNQFRRAVR